MAGDILWAGSSFPWMYISADTPSLIVLSLLSTLISTLKVLVFLSADEAIKVTSPEMYLPEINFAFALLPSCTCAMSFSAMSATKSMGSGSIRAAQTAPVLRKSPCSTLKVSK